MNDKLLNDFRKTILRVSPEKSDFDYLIKIFSSMEEDEAKRLNEIFAQDSSLVKIMIENIKAKKIILSNGNLGEWQNLIKKEEEIINGLL